MQALYSAGSDGGGSGLPNYQVRGTRYYVQNGAIIKEDQMIDPDSGNTINLPSVYQMLPAGINLPEGSEVDPNNLMASLDQASRVPSQASPADLAPRAPDASTAYGTPAQPSGGGNMQGSPDFNPEAQRALLQGVAGGQPAAGARDILGSGGSDAGRFSNQFLFDFDNPKMAIYNVLRDMGINPNNPANPFVQMMQRAGPGLATAFEMQHAGGPGLPAGTDYGQAFKDFLGSAIGGGNVMSTLGNAASALPGVIQGLRGLGMDQGANVNPLAQALMDTLSQNSGQGAIGALAALEGPGMNRSTFQGLQSGLSAALNNALRSGASDQFFNKGHNDVFSYLFGQ